MARRKTSDDSLVWLLVFGGIGYGIYAWLTSSGASAQTTSQSSQQSSPLLQGSASAQQLVPSVVAQGNQLEAFVPGQ